MSIIDLFGDTHHNRFFAQCPKGVEPWLSPEITQLGGSECQLESGGVSFTARAKDLYRIIYCSRLAGRVLLPMWSFPCQGEEDLYRRALELPWADLIPAHRTFMISSHLINSPLKHSQFASLKLKDAIVDSIRQQCGQRPSVDRDRPDIRINLLIQEQEALISLDPCGALHQRAYRLDAGMAPIKENLAAAILAISGWQADVPLVDPFCGSGTILGEALMMAACIPAGFKRSHQNLKFIPGFDSILWKDMKDEQDAQIHPIQPGLICGGDIHGQSIRKASHNLFRLPHGEQVALKKADFREWTGLNNHCIIANLPYGERLGDDERTNQLYKDLGDFLKRNCSGSRAWLLCGSTALVKRIGLHPKTRIPLFNGPLETRLIQLELYRNVQPSLT